MRNERDFVVLFKTYWDAIEGGRWTVRVISGPVYCWSAKMQTTVCDVKWKNAYPDGSDPTPSRSNSCRVLKGEFNTQHSGFHWTETNRWATKNTHSVACAARGRPKSEQLSLSWKNKGSIHMNLKRWFLSVYRLFDHKKYWYTWWVCC